MKKHDKKKKENMQGEPVHLFTVNFIKGIKVKSIYKNRKDAFEGSMRSYIQYLKSFNADDLGLACVEMDVYDWINSVLSGSYDAVAHMIALSPMELLYRISANPAVKHDISIADALFYILESVERIEDDGFYFKSFDRGSSFEMLFGWGEVRMRLTCVDVGKPFQVLEINHNPSEYVEKAICQALNMAGLTDKFGHFVDVMNHLAHPYSIDKFIEEEYGCIYKEDTFTPFGAGLREIAFLRYLYEQKNLYNRVLQIEVCGGNILIAEFNYGEHGILKLLISLYADDAHGRLFRVYKLPH